MSVSEYNGKWRYRFSFKGERISVTTCWPATPANMKKAMEEEALHRHKFRLEEWGTKPWAPTPFADAVVEFIPWYISEHQDKPNTWKRLRSCMAIATSFFGSKHVHLISVGDIERYKVHRQTVDRVRAPTLRNDLNALSVFFQWAAKFEITKDDHPNPCAKVKKPSIARSIRQHVLTPEEEALYFGHAKRDLHDVAKFILLQGMRPSEVTTLKWANVDFRKRTLKISEGKTPAARRELLLCDESVEILKRRHEIAKGSKWVFPSKKRPGRPILTVNKAHDELCRKIGFFFVLYDLRHTFATRLGQMGIDLYALASVLGHSSTAILKHYVHTGQQHMNNAMEAYNKARRQGTPESPPTQQAPPTPRPAEQPVDPFAATDQGTSQLIQ